MEVYILNSNYEQINYIDQAESILWNKKFNDVGYCEIYIPCDIEMLETLKIGNYIYREDDDMFCKIETVEIETNVETGDYLIVTASDINSILNGRIVRWEINYSGTVFNFIKKLINDNIINPAQSQRKISNFTFNSDNISEFFETINITSFTNDLLELVKTTCKTYNYGFRIKYLSDTQTLEFNLYKGQNRASITSDTYIEFSPDYGNIISSNYKEDGSNYKNVCYVGYKDSNEEIKLLSVFNTSTEPLGESRKEVYVDGTNLSREITEETLFEMFDNVSINDNVYYNIDDIAVATKNEDKIVATDYTYLLLIRILGLNALSERVKIQEFNGDVDTIDTYEYKTDYNLGDVVKVINDYGIEAEAQITEIMESDDTEDGYVVEPKFEYIN